MPDEDENQAEGPEEQGKEKPLPEVDAWDDDEDSPNAEPFVALNNDAIEAAKSAISAQLNTAGNLLQSANLAGETSENWTAQYRDNGYDANNTAQSAFEYYQDAYNAAHTPGGNADELLNNTDDAIQAANRALETADAALQALATLKGALDNESKERESVLEAARVANEAAQAATATFGANDAGLVELAERASTQLEAAIESMTRVQIKLEEYETYAQQETDNRQYVEELVVKAETLHNEIEAARISAEELAKPAVPTAISAAAPADPEYQRLKGIADQARAKANEDVTEYVRLVEEEQRLAKVVNAMPNLSPLVQACANTKGAYDRAFEKALFAFLRKGGKFSDKALVHAKPEVLEAKAAWELAMSTYKAATNNQEQLAKTQAEVKAAADAATVSQQAAEKAAAAVDLHVKPKNMLSALTAATNSLQSLHTHNQPTSPTVRPFGVTRSPLSSPSPNATQTVSLTSFDPSNLGTPEPIKDKEFKAFSKIVIAQYEILIDKRVTAVEAGDAMNITAPKPPFQIKRSGPGNYQVAIPDDIEAAKKIIQAVIKAQPPGVPLKIDLKDPQQIKFAQEAAEKQGIKSIELTNGAQEIMDKHVAKKPKL